MHFVDDKWVKKYMGNISSLLHVEQKTKTINDIRNDGELID